VGLWGWVLGVGAMGPNPHPPIPNPQSPFIIVISTNENDFLLKFKIFFFKN